MATIIEIDGETFDVPVLKLKRSADFLDKYAERVINGELKRELIGVYFNYDLTFGRAGSQAEYERLWEKLTEPLEFHTVKVPTEKIDDADQGFMTYKAYFAGVKDEFVRVPENGTLRVMKGTTVKFIAQKPARTPA